ncbi:hypothetical protein AOLI_G00141660 [Acnodon oligacanthus]
MLLRSLFRERVPRTDRFMLNQDGCHQYELIVAGNETSSADKGTACRAKKTEMQGSTRIKKHWVIMGPEYKELVQGQQKKGQLYLQLPHPDKIALAQRSLVNAVKDQRKGSQL